ncbi:MAG TPA: hypothetical protein DCG85_01000 [Lachnospiraceae bacterium]|nr:hypothetical protein [Lachnospiraceae bacterium]
MFEIRLSKNYIVSQTGTSEGTQVKYKKGGYWYKLNRDGDEGLCEYLCSKLLTFSDLKKDEYVIYEQGKINDMPGCRSKDFLSEDENLITIYRLYYNEYGVDLSKVIYEYDDIEDRIKYVLEFVEKSTAVDLQDYLSKLITLDRLILNEDRHLNNIALIHSPDGFRPAPIFDNGRSLLTANYSVNRQMGLERNVKFATAKPFSGSYDKMYNILGQGFLLDVEEAIKWLREEADSWEKEVLIYQLTTAS